MIKTIIGYFLFNYQVIVSCLPQNSFSMSALGSPLDRLKTEKAKTSYEINKLPNLHAFASNLSPMYFFVFGNVLVM